MNRLSSLRQFVRYDPEAHSARINAVSMKNFIETARLIDESLSRALNASVVQPAKGYGENDL